MFDECRPDGYPLAYNLTCTKQPKEKVETEENFVGTIVLQVSLVLSES
jgi:hypothetical protein